MSADDPVNHPSHYCKGRIEVWDAIADWGLSFCLGNVVKYVARAQHKGRQLEDLKKAQAYLEREIELLEGANVPVFPFLTPSCFMPTDYCETDETADFLRREECEDFPVPIPCPIPAVPAIPAIPADKLVPSLESLESRITALEQHPLPACQCTRCTG